MSSWGEIKLEQIDDADDFWCILDELVDDKSSFILNKNIILNALLKKSLFGLRVEETDEMFEENERNNPIFCKDSFYLLPCFCIKLNDTAKIIWTHSRARRRGFARCLIEKLKIKYAYNPLPESYEFWKKFNIEFVEKIPRTTTECEEVRTTFVSVS